jgi:hypothetical protein
MARKLRMKSPGKLSALTMRTITQRRLGWGLMGLSAGALIIEGTVFSHWQYVGGNWSDINGGYSCWESTTNVRWPYLFSILAAGAAGVILLARSYRKPPRPPK